MGLLFQVKMVVKTTVILYFQQSEEVSDAAILRSTWRVLMMMMAIHIWWVTFYNDAVLIFFYFYKGIQGFFIFTRRYEWKLSHVTWEKSMFVQDTSIKAMCSWLKFSFLWRYPSFFGNVNCSALFKIASNNI